MFVTALSKPERSVLDWRIMALQLLCYVTMQRFSDLQGIKVEDIRVLTNGDLRIFQKVGKTFQMGQGNYLYVLNKPFWGFTIKSLMDKYVLKLDLKSTGFLFPHFAKSSTGIMTVCRVPIGYGNDREELSHVLSSLSLQISVKVRVDGPKIRLTYFMSDKKSTCPVTIFSEAEIVKYVATKV